MKQLFRSLFVSFIAFCARQYLKRTKPIIIGITGSVGKTSCRMIVASTIQQLLPQEYVYTSPKNYNSDLGLSLSILGIEDYSPSVNGILNAFFESLLRGFFPSGSPTVLVLEYGIDAPGDMDQLLSIAIPDFAILTSIDHVHAQQFTDGITGIYNEKIKLLQACKDTLLYNNEIVIDPVIFAGKSVYSYSQIDGGVGDMGYHSYNVTLSGKHVIGSFIYSVGTNNLTVTTNISGSYNMPYVCIGLTIVDIISHRKQYSSLWSLPALSLDLRLQPGRFTLFSGKEGELIIDSTYNASPESMKKVIEETLELKNQFFSDYHLICVLGEMRELGERSKEIHTHFGEWLFNKIDNLIAVSGDSVYISDYMLSKNDVQKNIFRVENNMNVSDIVRQIKDRLGSTEKYMLLFKSSQGEIRLEEAIKEYIEKDQYSLLPRQEGYWIQKKQFAKKLFIH